MFSYLFPNEIESFYYEKENSEIINAIHINIRSLSKNFDNLLDILSLVPTGGDKTHCYFEKTMEIKKVCHYRFRSTAIILALSLYVPIESVWTQKVIAPKVSVFTFEQNG